MQKIAKFEKVSFEQFEKDWKKAFPDTADETVREIYETAPKSHKGFGRL